MSLPDFERSAHSPGHAVFHLERMALLLERLGNPHLEVPTVHVAGTKGKGSTAAMVASILTAEGYKTGLYTSPHLHTLVERIRVGLDPIKHEEFTSLVDQSWPAVEWVGERGDYGPVTFFEMVTALAFLHFKQIGADFQVIEVGAGRSAGRDQRGDPFGVCNHVYQPGPYSYSREYVGPYRGRKGRYHKAQSAGSGGATAG